MRVYEDGILLNVVPGKFNTFYRYSEFENKRVANVLIRLNDNYRTFCRRMKLEYEDA